jgi:tetratricopeptide (TPR) repeat protein
LEGARSLSRWQFLIATMIDGQVGTILYAHKQRLDEAQPYLEKAIVKNWYAKCMLAATHFKRREYDDMVRVFEETVKNNKEAAMAWAAYAWCEAKRGRRPEAIGVLERAMKELPDEDRLKRNLIALQNKKRINMKAFTPEWWVLHLERPPGQVMAGGRMSAPPGARMKMKKMR